MHLLRGLAIALVVPVILAARLHSLPDDPHAFPKYRVAFLNSLPVLNETAQRWLIHGLHGGELEFLDQPWKDDVWSVAPSPKEIDGAAPSHGSISTSNPPAQEANHTLHLMKMGPKDSYLCLIPKPLDHTTSLPQDDPAESEVTPARTWSLLQPLTGTCLYHRQGWFTYSYCHNEEIRQFKELIPTHPHVAGTYKPEEDPEWEAYTLGKAPKPGDALTVAEQNAQAVNLELARNAGSRYLVQRWGEGTICDKTGKHREVEVQFHCSMTMTDTILFVKETKTCSYVLVINTPRLCGEPGFKSRRDLGEEAQIRCREVVDVMPDGVEFKKLPDTDHPLKLPRRKPVLPPPVKDSGKKEKGPDVMKVLEAFLANKDSKLKRGSVYVDGLDEDEEMVVEVLNDGEMGEAELEAANKLVEMFRAVGFDVRAEGLVKKEGEQKSNKDPDTSTHDEL